MPRPLKLYNYALAPNPRRVRIFAAEKGIELALEDVDILAGQSRTPEFLTKNSSGAVPVLELDDGSWLSESVAICRYLEGLQPEPNLLGRDLREQVEIERWNRRMELELFIQSHARLRIPVRSFKTALSSPRIRRGTARGRLSAVGTDGSGTGGT
jgi:glutathione S-transferase